MDKCNISLLTFLKDHLTSLNSILELLKSGYSIYSISKNSVVLKKANAIACICSEAWYQKNPEGKVLSKKSTEFLCIDSTFDFIFRKFYNRSHDSFYLPDWTHKNLPMWTRKYNSPISFVLIFLRYFRRISWRNFVREFKRQASRQYVFNTLASEERWCNDSHSNGFIAYPVLANKIIQAEQKFAQ